MVKNTKGGKGAKGLARKTSIPTSNTNEKLRYAVDEMERYACVTKMFGNGMCEITLNDRSKLIGHIRGAFRGKQKHRNTIIVNTIVLVGLREWEDQKKNCDILYIYDDNQIIQLQCQPQIDIKNLLIMKLSHGEKQCENSNIQFSNETEEESKAALETIEEFIINAEGQIDIDDI